jgi:hypothetical protein
MAKYWDKLNPKNIGALHMRARIASEVQEDHIEGLIIQAALLEALLRIAITIKVGPRRRTHKKYWDGNAKFSQLIAYYELLDGKRELIKSLDKYNIYRNKIVHSALQYPSIKALIEEARKTYNLGKEIEKKLLRVAGFKIPKNFDKPLGLRREIIEE